MPNRSVVHTARDGTVRVTDVNGNTKVAGKLNVYTHDEEGLQGVAVDPNFATNRYIWLYYSPRLSTPNGDAPTTGTQAQFDQWKGELHLSRFTLKTGRHARHWPARRWSCGSPTTAASAVTWAATSTSTPRATST